MESETETLERSFGRSLLQSAPTFIAAYLGALAIIAYPLGFFIFWIQIWREYTHDASIALHATALIPIPVAVGKSLTLLDLLTITAIGPLLISSNLGTRRTMKLFWREEMSTSDSWVIRFYSSSIYGVGSFLSTVFLIFASPFLVQVVLVDSVTDWFFYACFLVTSVVGGVLAFPLLSKGGIEGQDSRSWMGGIILLVVSSILAAMLLVPLRQSQLPTVEFDNSSIEEAALISHKDGYWYVLQNEERTLRAIPDSTVGRVSISDSSR